MSGKKLTRKEFEALPKMTRGSDWARRICELTDSAEAMAVHIEAVGVFAPEKPTDEEINEAIAKAQGWEREDDPDVDGTGMCRGISREWHRDGKCIIEVADYSPVSNLGQALEAAAALGHMVSAESLPSGTIGWAFRDKSGLEKSAADAARAISLRLYHRIKDGDL